MRYHMIGLAAGVFAVLAGARADVITPTSYSMLNGETGSFTYWDDSYNGSGSTTTSLSPLSGGLGDLTNGVVATANWFTTPGPYVGWQSVVPDILFAFTGNPTFTSVTLYLDDSNGNGGVAPPSSARVTIGTDVLNFPIADPAGGEPFFVTLPIPNLAGNSVRIELFDGAAPWIFLSEVSFNGLVPGPAAGSVLLLAGMMAARRRR